MMKITNRFLFLLFLTFFLFLGCDIFMSRWFQEKRIVSTIEKSFNSEIQKHNQIKSQISDDSVEHLWNYIPVFDEKRKDQIIFLVYSNDTIIYWNTNCIEPTKDQLQEIENQKQTVLQIGNSYCLSTYQRLEKDNLDVYLFSLIYFSYPFQNNYLESKLNASIFNIDSDVRITTNLNEGTQIKDDSGKEMFSVCFDNVSKIELNASLLLLSLFIVFLTFIYILIFKILSKNQFLNKHPLLLLLSFVVVTVLIRKLFSFFSFGLGLFSTELFESVIINSEYSIFNFGALTLDVHLLLVFAIIFKKYIPKIDYHLNSWLRYVLVSLFFLCIYGLFVFFTTNLIYHTSIPLSFTELYKLNTLSYLAFCILSLLSVTCFLFMQKMFSLLLKRTDKIWKILLVYCILLTAIFFFLDNAQTYGIFSFIIGFLLFLSFTSFECRNRFRSLILLIVTYATLLSLLLTYIFYETNEKRTNSDLQLTAYKLGQETDPMFEFLYSQIPNQLINDTIVRKTIFNNKENSEDILIEYLKNNYLDDYFSRYSVVATVCYPEQTLIIQPDNFEVDCMMYFKQLTNGENSLKIDSNLYYIDDQRIGSYYISLIKIADSLAGKEANLILEFYYKFIPEGIGYPEFLVDEKNAFTSNLSQYSFAIYQNDVLIYKFGNYLYPTFFEDNHALDNQIVTYNRNKHYTHKINDNKTLIVSLKQKKLIDIIAPFSYFFIFFGFVSFLIIGLIFFNKRLVYSKISFSFKVQSIILLALGLSFAIIGFSSIFFIQGVYEKKTNDFLAERTSSILIELEQQLKETDLDNAETSDNLHKFLQNLSLVFFSDINLYDVNGQLLACSRPDIFKFDLISELMNAEAYQKMHFDKELYFVHKEYIGKGEYYSSYIPFLDSEGNTRAYLNLPYFARETETRGEISSLLLAYVNVFLLLIGLSTILALLLSRRLTKPLSMIQEKMKEVRIDKVNEPITWKSDDEIGQLVEQYNELLSELEKSANLLAKSERETAWREMARQVAHEIKNPLTPMRLSVQYLQRSWNDNDPDIDEKLKRTTNTLIEQIDSLSSIASAFSDFARMPANNPEYFDLVNLLQRTAELYNEQLNITINLNFDASKNHMFFADKNNLGRAFGNIIKNAVQAIGQQKNGKIDISIQSLQRKYIVTITDNGPGMSEEEKKKIFIPNFTTKSSGMGIGLSIVHNIIQSLGGNIRFESEIGKGTTFFVELYQNE